MRPNKPTYDDWGTTAKSLYDSTTRQRQRVINLPRLGCELLRSACLCASLSVCLSARIYLKNSKIQTSRNCLYMLPAVTVVRPSSDSIAVRHLLSVLDNVVDIMKWTGQNQRRRARFVHFARWWHRGEVCCLRLNLV